MKWQRSYQEAASAEFAPYVGEQWRFSLLYVNMCADLKTPTHKLPRRFSA